MKYKLNNTVGYSTVSFHSFLISFTKSKLTNSDKKIRFRQLLCINCIKYCLDLAGIRERKESESLKRNQRSTNIHLTTTLTIWCPRKLISLLIVYMNL